MLFKEIIPVFIENYERSISMNAALLIAKPSEIYLPMGFKGLRCSRNLIPLLLTVCMLVVRCAVAVKQPLI
jgi:hypothetical protein